MEKTENSITYRRFKKAYQVSFISTENLEEFENFLNMTIAEAKMRAKCV